LADAAVSLNYCYHEHEECRLLDLRRLALIKATQRNIPGDSILHSHRRENLKSYTTLICLKHAEHAGNTEVTMSNTQQTTTIMKDAKYKFVSPFNYCHSDFSVKAMLHYCITRNPSN
jgi:hypothetical protein